MKYFALLTLLVMCGCAAKSKAPHKKQMFQFVGIHADGTCDVNEKLTHWDAKTGALVLTCKPENK